MKNIQKLHKYILENKLIFGLELYLFVTVFIYLKGPFKYSYNNISLTLTLSIAYPIIILVGYYLAWKWSLKKGKNVTSKYNIKFIVKILIITTIISLIINYLHISYIIGTNNPLQICKTIINSVSGLGDAYLKNIERGKLLAENGSLITKLVTFFSPLFQISFVIGILYFRKVSTPIKILIATNVGLTISLAVIKGQNFGFFSIIILIITTTLLNLRNSKKQNRKVFVIIFILLALFILYFSVATIGRLKPINSLASLYGIPIDGENWLFKLTPRILHNPIILGASYVSQGYHGLSLALSERFTPAFGFGNGYFALRIGKIFLGTDMFDRTYQAKISDVWHPKINWHTAYTWFANDVSFYGVIIVMVLLGAAFFVILKSAKNGDLLAISLLPIYIILIIFLPMNNVILGNSSTAFQFIVLNGLFIFNKLILTNKIEDQL